MIRHDLHDIPPGSLANRVDVSPTVKDGRRALRIALDAATRRGKPGVDFVDQPSFLLLPEVATNAVIEVDVCARLLPDAPDYARGFIGLSYRVQPDLSAYESLYIRPTNGALHAPDPPRGQRAIQYYAFPEWPFDVLRNSDPGRFEAGAAIGIDRWHRLTVDVSGHGFAAGVDGIPVLSGTGKTAARPGRIGLWVDIGTEGFFSRFSMLSQGD